MLLPLAVVAMGFCGLVGALTARILAPAGNLPEAQWQLGVLGAFDALGIVTLVHVLLFQNAQSQFRLHPVVVFLMFILIGAKCGRGQGLAWIAVWGLANGAAASAVALAIVAALRRLDVSGRDR